MPSFGPVSRADLVAALRRAGFEGPVSGSKHQLMIRKNLRLVIPNSHASQVGKELLSRIIKQAGISRQEWEQL